MRSVKALIQGQVQGLGFRPYVYRLAKTMGVFGTVSNSSRGVEVVGQGPNAESFMEKLQTAPPPLARVSRFEVSTITAPKCSDFRIVKSRRESTLGVDVLPDISVCAECRKELLDRRDRRYRYPFINCTQCGPRYTIIESLPYDRPQTTMRRFSMCLDCRKEYCDPADRRFHAQPDACAECGPQVRLHDGKGNLVAGDAVRLAAGALARGKVVAIKSLGGFQLACDATNDRAVRLLRRRKDRPTKPLAMMCCSIGSARALCRINRASRSLLTSPAAPIVLMPKRSDPRIQVSERIAPDNRCYGVMLAYTPLHALLIDELRRRSGRESVLVMTSANRRNEPITATEEELLTDLHGVFDYMLTHDRPIANRCDDSVVLGTDEAIMSRRARGYAPQPIVLDRPFHVKRPVLALGGELRNCFALAHGHKVYLSPHIGDVSSPRGESYLLKTLKRYIEWTGIRPEAIACDLHPDYASTRLAERLSRRIKAPLYRIQHHYAHVISVMAERGLRGPVLGIACDGTGFGTDGAVWGCEFLLVGPDLNWKRVGHLDYLKLTEGGGVLANPSRVAAGYLLQSVARVPRGLGIGRHAAAVRAKLNAGQALDTSSLGRLFDAVAGMTGVCRDASFEGEAPIALEAAAASCSQADVSRETRFWATAGIKEKPDVLLVDPRPLIAAVVAAVLEGEDRALVAACFHRAVTTALSRAALILAARHRTATVVLSGGSFQNSILRRGIRCALSRSNVTVEHNESLPVNDGGVALGQAVAVGARRSQPSRRPAGSPRPVRRCVESGDTGPH
jgi:hydrogenase maturation protein HypF